MKRLVGSPGFLAVATPLVLLLSLSVPAPAALRADSVDDKDRATTGAASAPAPLVVRVPAFALGPRDIEARLIVARHGDNRVLRVEVDAPAFYRSSEIQLDGDDAPRHHSILWRHVPPGHYTFRATLLRADGTARQVSRSMDVMPAASESPE